MRATLSLLLLGSYTACGLVVLGGTRSVALGRRSADRRSADLRMQFAFPDLSEIFSSAKPKPAAPRGGLPEPKDVFDEELSAWPAIIEIQDALEKLSPDEQRRLKLEVGTNWPPRTTTASPFDINREGYMFFQAPTPKTSVQEDLPSFFETDLSQVEVPTTLKIVGGTFGVSLAAVGGVLVLG